MSRRPAARPPRPADRCGTASARRRRWPAPPAGRAARRPPNRCRRSGRRRTRARPAAFSRCRSHSTIASVRALMSADYIRAVARSGCCASMTRRNASTTPGSNCRARWRSISAIASATGQAGLYGRCCVERVEHVGDGDDAAGERDVGAARCPRSPRRPTARGARRRSPRPAAAAETCRPRGCARRSSCGS